MLIMRWRRRTCIWAQFSAAYGELARTVDLQPTNYKARIDLGNLLLAGGKTDDAQVQANAVMAAQPNNPDVHALLSAIAVRRGQKDQALTEIQRALELDPNRAAFHEDLALLQAGDPTKASSVEDELKKAVALDPKSVNAKLLLAAFYAKNSRWPEAEKVSWDAVATDPKSLSARANACRGHSQAGQIRRGPRKCSVRRRRILPTIRRECASWQTTTRAPDRWTRPRRSSQALPRSIPRILLCRRDTFAFFFEVKDYATAQTVVAGLMKNSSKDPEVAALNGIVLLNDGKASDAVNALQNARQGLPEGCLHPVLAGQGGAGQGRYRPGGEELSPGGRV